MNKEFGRSMVEMLGVLAVMGVLSMGAIAGYKYAINKHAANVTQNELSKWATVYAAQLVKNDVLNTSEMGSLTQMKYWIAAKVSPVLNEYFIISLSNVPPKVCEQLVENDWETPIQIIASGLEYRGNSNVCGNQNTTLDYLFYRDLSGQGQEDDCPVNSRCGEVCCDAAMVCDVNGKTCVPPDNKECVTNEDCGKEGNGKYFCNKKAASLYEEQEMGTCQKVSYLTTTVRNGTAYYLSKGNLLWPTADRFCRALGKQMVSKPVDFGCAANSIDVDNPLGNVACQNETFLDIATAWMNENYNFWTGNCFGTNCYDMSLRNGHGSHCAIAKCSYRALCR